MSNNPYSEPDFNPYNPSTNVGTSIESDAISLPPGIKRGMVNQVPILGVLMIVQGVMDSLVGIAIGFYAIFMPTIMEEMQRQAAAQGNQAQPMPPNLGVAMTVGIGLFALVIAAVGILTVYSGIRLIKYRSRFLAITALCAGMTTIATCYCFPTSIALAIYGLIVLLNSPVTLAFDLRRRGHDVNSIQRSFLSLNQ